MLVNPKFFYYAWNTLNYNPINQGSVEGGPIVQFKSTFGWWIVNGI